jgi:hypothetical protein
VARKKRTSLESVDRIDYMGIGVDDTILLTLIDDFDGDDERERIGMLQRKIRRYLDFIESGEVWESLRASGQEAKPGAPMGISILAMNPLGEQGEEFLEHIRSDARQRGIDVEFEAMPDQG